MYAREDEGNQLTDGKREREKWRAHAHITPIVLHLPLSPPSPQMNLYSNIVLQSRRLLAIILHINLSFDIKEPLKENGNYGSYCYHHVLVEIAVNYHFRAINEVFVTTDKLPPIRFPLQPSELIWHLV